MRLTEAEREHLFLLGLGHLPEVRYRACDAITPRLQHVLDVLTDKPGHRTHRHLGRHRLKSGRRPVAFTDYDQLAPRRAQYIAFDVL
ncbi:MAG: hypothetical protein ACR5LG_01025 [Sodalis sp. (in: enterobacteria)]|uniref:hypothetical protein n=1 Tax=Sodalis sp. (in: enterobacteria) TaxID=1898979 RepID=UPI003F37CDEF